MSGVGVAIGVDDYQEGELTHSTSESRLDCITL